MGLPGALHGGQGISAQTPQSTQVLKFEIGAPPASDMLRSVVESYVKAFADLGYQLELIQYPSARGLHVLKNQSVQGTLARMQGLHKMVGFENLRAIGDPVLNLDVTLFCRAAPRSILAKDWKKKLQLVTRGGNFLSSHLARHVDQTLVQFSELDRPVSIVKMLKSARVDCYIDSEFLIEAFGVDLAELHRDIPYRWVLYRIPTYVYLQSQLADLEKPLLKALKSYPQDPKWIERFRSDKLKCSVSQGYICPDGTVFKRPFRAAL